MCVRAAAYAAVLLYVIIVSFGTAERGLVYALTGYTTSTAPFPPCTSVVWVQYHLDTEVDGPQTGWGGGGWGINEFHNHLALTSHDKPDFPFSPWPPLGICQVTKCVARPAPKLARAKIDLRARVYI